VLKFQIITIALLLGAILLIANSNLYEYASAQTVSKKTETMCQAIYKSYKQLGKSEFLKKFSGTAYINDCLKLYDDPSWTFKGKTDVDKFYSKTKKTDDPLKQSTKGTVKLLSKSKIGDSKYVSKVSVCSAKEGIRKPVILIQSDKEKFVGVTSITVPPQQCRDFFTQISSNNPNTIKSTLLEGMEIPKGITVKQMK
jgi:hypothetical protein